MRRRREFVAAAFDNLPDFSGFLSVGGAEIFHVALFGFLGLGGDEIFVSGIEVVDRRSAVNVQVGFVSCPAVDFFEDSVLNLVDLGVDIFVGFVFDFLLAGVDCVIDGVLNLVLDFVLLLVDGVFGFLLHFVFELVPNVTELGVGGE